MKIMILANSDLGLFAFRKELIEEFVKEHEVIVVVPFGKKIDQLISLGGTYINASINRRGTNIFQDYKLFKNYKKLMKQENPDIVITYTIKPNIYGGMAAKSLNIPHIANITGLGTAVENKGLLQKITTILYRIALRKSHTVFFQNEENMLYFQKNKIALNRHQLIPGSGVNLSKFKVLPFQTNKNVTITYIGRIMKNKGINELLSAIRIINNVSIRFKVVGDFEDGYAEDEIMDLTNKGLIEYYPFREDVVPIIMSSDVIINPSYHEGMSNILLEAAASGRPLLASNITGCKEIVEDGMNGFLFKPKNVESLIETIEKFLTLSEYQKQQMGMNSRAKVEKQFDRQIVVNKYIELINTIIYKSKESQNGLV